MTEINNFPINTLVFEELDPITDAQATDSDGVLFFDESVGVMKRMTRGELFKGKVIPINSIADFASLPVETYSDRQQFHLNAFAPDGSSGGGPLMWTPNQPKSLHDGIRYFSPTVPAPADFNNPTDVQNYMDGVGEEFPTADGIFELTLYSIQSSEFPSIDGALVLWDGTSGTMLKNGVVPSLIGIQALQIPNIAAVSYARFNADETISMRTLVEHKTDLQLNNVDNTSDSQKVVSGPIADALALKAPLASPALTGTPTAPTAAANTNTEQLATTAFVQGELTDRIQSVATIADLEALTGLTAGQEISLLEYDAGDEIGGGDFYVSEDASSPSNGGTIIVSSDGKRIKRKFTGTISVMDFGAKGDGSTDDTNAFARANDYGISIGGCNIYMPPGRYVLSGTGIQTARSNSYFRLSDFSNRWFGAGTSTVLTRNEDQASDVMNFADPAAYHQSVINIHSGNHVFENFLIENAKSAIYMGETSDTVDVCHGSMCRFRNIWIANCGVGLHMRSGLGNYYNAFENFHIWQCQIGMYIAKHPNSLITAANNNRNQFRHIRVARSYIGLWMKDGDTNQFIGQHNEGNTATPSNNRYAAPGGLPFGMSAGIGQVLEENAKNNEFVAGMQEACDVELANGGENNSFTGLYRDATFGKVRHIQKPYFYSSRTMFVTNQGTTYYFNNPQPDIFLGKKAGVVHNELETRTITGTRIDVSSNDYDASRGIDLGALASGASAELTLWAENTDESASTAYFDINIVGNSQSTPTAHVTRCKVIALRNSSRTLTRYYIYDVNQARATGAGLGDLTEPFTPALSLSGNNLMLTVTAPARAFASVVATVRTILTK